MKAILALLLCCAAAPLWAAKEPQDSKQPVTLGRFELLARKDVLDDLALDQEMREKVKEVNVTAQHATAKVYDTRKTPEEVDAGLNVVRAQHRAELEALLTLEQVARLRQIQLQELGAAALAEPDVIEALRPSDEQQVTMKEIAAQRVELRRNYLEKVKNREVSIAKGFEELQAEEKKLYESLLRSLSKEQLATYRALLGKPFKAYPLKRR